MSFMQSRIYNGLSAVVDRLFPKTQTYQYGDCVRIVRRKPLMDPYDFSGFEHERTILRKLEDVKGVPKLFLGGASYGFEYTSSKPLAKAEILSQSYFEDLRGLVATIHGKGIAKLNYDNPKSVLIDANGNPVVTDFSKAVTYENGGIAAYPKMWPIFLQHFEGLVDRKARPPNTLRQDLQLSKRIRAYSKRVIKNRKQKRFEQAKKLDRGFILSEEMAHQQRELTDDEVQDLGYFLESQRAFQR
ncbi:hypothetical protein HYX07_00370 [Candidatus Woesearchaeota archaeon]|nr:hypothetical protein [Candidatus Woesearchaeota archaeon]